MSLVQFLEKARVSKFHYTLLMTAALAYAFTAMDVMIISIVLKPIANEWGLTNTQLGFLVSLGYLGMFFGAIGFGFVSDKIGRKKPLALTILIYSIFTSLCGLAPDYLTLSLLRLIAGIGLGGALPIPGVYIAEYTPAEKRGTFVGLVETSWVWGVLLGLFLGFYILPEYGWRVTFYIGVLPLIILPLIIGVIPESIRYLEKKGKFDYAVEILKSKGIIETGDVIEKPEFVDKKISLLKLFEPKYLTRTILLFILWMALVYTYHGIFIWLPKFYADKFFTVKGALMWAIVVTLFQIPGYYSATFLLDKWGRKPVLTVYLIGAGVGSFLLTLFNQTASEVLIISIIISFFNLGAWAGLYTYTPEMYPTEYRGLGSGTAASSGRFAGIFAPYVTGFLYDIGGLVYPFIVFAVVHIIAAISVVILGIETKGETLERLTE